MIAALTTNNYEILQIMPAEGWLAGYHNEDKPGEAVWFDVICWAVIRWTQTGSTSVEGIISLDNETLPAPGDRADDKTFFGYLKSLDKNAPCKCIRCEIERGNILSQKNISLDANLDKNIEDVFDLDTRIKQCMYNSNIFTVRDLLSMSRRDLNVIQNFGRVSFRKLVRIIREAGYEPPKLWNGLHGVKIWVCPT